mgnify:CR=1 FL=1
MMELLARGRDAQVYALDSHRVLRQFDAPRDLRREVAAMECARAAGLPVPAVHEVTVDGMVLDRVDGPTMFEALAADPSTARQHAATLAELHHRVGAVAAPAELFTDVGEGDALLHLDLHPGNVILGSVPTIIDWTNAARGPADADPAVCWLLLRVVAVDDLGVRPALVETFLEAFLESFDRDALAGQLAAIARLRLVDPNTSPVERDRIRRFVADPW